MKKIIINSKTHGRHEVLVDDGDYQEISKHKWCLYPKGITFYAITKVNRIVTRMHRMIIAAKPGQLIDHKDGNGLNNTRNNIRIATFSQNAMNRKKRIGSSSQFKGVFKIRSKFQSRITVNYKDKSLGYFSLELDAAKAYNEAAIKYHGEFARLNDIPCAV